jgi:hypothetical protein
MPDSNRRWIKVGGNVNARVRQTDSVDCSTNLMISSFSDPQR